MSSVHPLPRDQLTPLSAARAAFAHATAQLRDELEAFEAVTAPVVRLGKLGTDLAALDREIADLRRDHETALGVWLAGGQLSERPMPSLRIALLERTRAPLAGDVAAAERIRPAAERLHQEGAQKVRDAQARRDEALAIVAVEAAAEFARTVYAEKITAVLACESVLRGLGAELAPRNRAAAQAIGELVVQTRRAISVAQNNEPGHRLLEALNTNARVTLEAT
jgi:hypothetical protein